MSLFFRRDMHRRVGEVSQSAGMIGIPVRQHDVANIVCTETKLFNSPHGRVFFMKLKTSHIDQLLAQPLDGSLNIQQANPCINKSQSGAVLQK